MTEMPRYYAKQIQTTTDLARALLVGGNQPITLSNVTFSRGPSEDDPSIFEFTCTIEKFYKRELK
jgi:hypothetical protein